LRVGGWVGGSSGRSSGGSGWRGHCRCAAMDVAALGGSGWAAAIEPRRTWGPRGQRKGACRCVAHSFACPRMTVQAMFCGKATCCVAESAAPLAAGLEASLPQFVLRPAGRVRYGGRRATVDGGQGGLPACWPLVREGGGPARGGGERWCAPRFEARQALERRRRSGARGDSPPRPPS
jgi:hypothetical protein